MRRSVGIQALECHVLIPRSTLESNQIVNCIRSACSKYKFDVTQQTDVFQYEPYLVEKNNYESHVDLITGLNTSSNGISLTGSKLANESKKNKQEVNLGIKNNQSLLSKLKANLRDSSKENSNSSAAKTRDGMPPLPSRSKASNIKITNQAKQEIKSDPQTKQATSTTTVKIIEQKQEKKSEKNLKTATTSQVNFSDTKKESKKLNSQSTSSLKQPHEQKKLSLGKRILESARSSLKSSSSKSSSKLLSSHSVTSLSSKKDSFDYKNNLADIDFRKSRTSFIDESLLIDANLAYPIVHHIKRDNNPNFILKSRSTVATNTPMFVQQQQQISQQNRSCHQSNSSLNLTKKLMANYQSTPSLVIEDTNMRRVPSNNDLLRASNRAVSVAAVQRNMSRPASPSRHCSIANIDRIRSPQEDPNLLSTHLVWNKNSKSAESLDTKKIVNSIIKNEQTVIARAISPGIPSFNPNLNRELINKSQECLNYQARRRESPVAQHHSVLTNNGPFTKSVIVIRSDDYNIIQPPDLASTPLMGPFCKHAATASSSNEIDLESISKASKSNSRLDLFKYQFDEQDRSTSNASSKSSYKLVGNSVRVLPSSEAEMLQRRARLKEIEDNLYKDSMTSFHHHQINDVKTTKSSEYYQFNSSFTDYSDNDHEVIDLTKQASLIDNACKTTDLPIEICLSNPSANSNELKINNRIINLEPYTISKTEFGSTTSSCYENESTTHIAEQTSSSSNSRKHCFNQVDNNNQINYVYYYGSNEDFEGY